MKHASIALLACALSGSVAHAAPALVSARLEASLLPSQGATPHSVEVVLRLTARPDGAREMPLLALAIGGTSIDDVVARARPSGATDDTRAQPLEVGLVQLPPRTELVLDLPETGTDAATTTHEPLEIVVRYRVDGAVRSAGGMTVTTLPVLVPRWRPDAATPGLFEARITLPARHAVVRSFPTGGRAGVDGTVPLDLPATPSMVRIASREGTHTFLTTEYALDALVILGLLALAGFGWHTARRFR